MGIYHHHHHHHHHYHHHHHRHHRHHHHSSSPAIHHHHHHQHSSSSEIHHHHRIIIVTIIFIHCRNVVFSLLTRSETGDPLTWESYPDFFKIYWGQWNNTTGPMNWMWRQCQDRYTITMMIFDFKWRQVNRHTDHVKWCCISFVPSTNWLVAIIFLLITYLWKFWSHI